MIKLRLRVGDVKKRFSVVFLAVLGYSLIQYNAINFIADIYNLYRPKELEFTDVFVSAVWGLLPAVFLPLRTSPSAAAGWIYYAFIYLSAAAVGVTVHESLLEYSSYMSFLSLGMLVVCLFARIPFAMPVVRIPTLRFDFIILLTAVSLGFYAWSLGGFVPSFGIDDAYERRMSARDTVGMSGYILAPLRLLVPILAIYAFSIRRNPLFIFVFLVGALGIFSYDGTKSIILYFCLMCSMMLGIRKNNLAVYLLGLIASLNIAALIERQFVGSLALLDYVIRRAFVVPGDLSVLYWKHLPLSSDLANITYEIGEIYSGDPTTNGNANFMMFGWVWSGWLGGLIVAASAGLILSVFQCVPNARYPCLGSLMASASMLIWAEQFLHTSLLSSGVLWVLCAAVIIAILPNSFGQLGDNLPKRDTDIS
jgi:hypothetical protein